MDGVLIQTATSILTRAVQLDNEKRFTESMVCYQEGIHVLLEALKTIPNDDPRRMRFRSKAEEYMNRAEKLKDHIEELKQKGSYREQVQVQEDATGFSYKSVLSRFLDEVVTTVEIEDPYVRSPHQCDNFVRFMELCVKNCRRLKKVKLITGRDANGYQEQHKRLESIRKSLHQKCVEFTIEFSDSLHDREIRLDNGWVIKIGRGLDYFKPVDRFSLGFSDYDLRPCKATTIDVFHKKELERVT